jgi:predicted NBD/HSP70 family sugar kinase
VHSIVPRQRGILQAIWRAGRLSRRDLHERTGIRPNTVGSDAAMLLKEGILRECTSKSLGRGRPRVPLEIDPDQRHVIGLAIRSGHVEVSRLNLLGQVISDPVVREGKDSAQVIAHSATLLQERIREQTLGVGISTPGFVDPARRQILFSAMTARGGTVDLHPTFEAARRVPVVLENDMHALAARWLLTRQAQQREDVLLVYFEDGQLGSALLIDGRPNRGCVTGANELGHTRLPVDTAICFCGHAGCLERICSSDFLTRHGSGNGTLAERAKAFNGSDPAMTKLVEYLAMGFSNALNFTRVNRLVLVSDLTAHEQFAAALTVEIRNRTLTELAGCARVEMWNQPAARSAETAGWLALASLYYEGWDHSAAETTEEMKELPIDN